MTWLGLMKPFYIILNFWSLRKDTVSSSWGLFVQNFFEFAENVEVTVCLGLCFNCGQKSKHMIGHMVY